MKIRLVSIPLLAPLLAHSKHAIARIATTTIAVGATVVASCTLPMSGQPTGEITPSCTTQTAVRIGEVSTADANQSLAVDTDQPLIRSSERINPTTRIKEITIEC